MDPLSDVLLLLKPAGFGFRGLDAAGDWSLLFDADEDLKVFAIEHGSCRLAVPAAGIETEVGEGDVVLLPGGTAYRLFSTASAPPSDAKALFATFPAGTTGTLNGGGECLGVGGFFDFRAPHADLLLSVLPLLIHVRAERTRSTLASLIRRLMDELREPQLGGALIAGHLAQTLLVEALRLHLADAAPGSGWLAALADRRLRSAIAAMHARPGRAWSLAELAREAGMSRSAFAERFKQAVGQPPLEYLTRWRMLLAADMLADGRTTLAAVAPIVGYESENALSVAFKRVLGRSPRQFLRDGRPPHHEAPRGSSSARE